MTQICVIMKVTSRLGGSETQKYPWIFFLTISGDTPHWNKSCKADLSASNDCQMY